MSRDPKEKGCWVWVALSISLEFSSMCSWTCFVFCRKEEGYGTAPTFDVSIIMGKRDEVVLVDHPLVIVACPSLRASLGVRTSAVYYCYRVDTFGVSWVSNGIVWCALQPLLVACARQLIEHIRFAFYTFVMHFLWVVCRFLLALVELSWIKYLMVSSKDFWHSNSMMFEYYSRTQ